MAQARLAEHFEDVAKQTHAARFGTWLFLGSESLLFSGLFALYASYRTMYPEAFSEAIRHNDARIGTANTAVLITSSLTVALAVHAVRSSNPRGAARLLGASILLGLVFLTLKGVEYSHHIRDGILPATHYHFGGLPAPGAKMFFSLYYAMTLLHALHVVVGLVFLALLAWGCHVRLFDAEYHTPVELGGLYWHLVDVIWIFLWPLLYLMHR